MKQVWEESFDADEAFEVYRTRSVDRQDVVRYVSPEAGREYAGYVRRAA